MKKLIALSIVLFAAFSSFAQTHVRGYTRTNGTYVAPHYRSSPNYTKADNYWILRTIVYHLFQRIVYQCFSPKFTSKFCFGIFISGHSLPLVAT